jgi:hypothetical protein
MLYTQLVFENFGAAMKSLSSLMLNLDPPVFDLALNAPAAVFLVLFVLVSVIGLLNVLIAQVMYPAIALTLISISDSQSQLYLVLLTPLQTHLHFFNILCAPGTYYEYIPICLFQLNETYERLSSLTRGYANIHRAQIAVEVEGLLSHRFVAICD